MTDKKYPSDPTAEIAILGSLMLEPENIRHIKTQIDEKMFTSRARKQLYRALLELHEEEVPFDFICLSNKLKNNGGIELYGGMEGLMNMLDVPTAKNINHYSDIVRRAHFYKEIIDKSDEIARSANTGGKDLLDVIHSASALYKEHSVRTGNIDLSLKRIILSATERVSTSRDIIPWGLTRIDKKIGGILRRQPIVVAGRPSHLKTTFVCSPIPYWIDTLGLKVMVLSLEVSSDMYLRKIVCQREKFDSGPLNNYSLTEAQKIAFISACNKLYSDYEGKLVIVDASKGAKDLNTMEQAARKFKPDIFIVDYMGLIPTSKQHRRIEMEEHFLFLKELTTDIDAAFLPVVQISRAPMKKQNGTLHPRIEDIKESGSIEENACQIYLLYYHYTQTEDKKDIFKVRVNVGKNKYGPLGTWFQYYDPAYCQIRDLGFDKFGRNGETLGG